MKYELAIAFTIVLISITACMQEPTGQVVQEEPITIGIMTILSGDLAFLGQNIVQSATIAAEGHNIKLIVEDVGDLGSGAQAVAAYKKLVDVDGVDIIISGMSSDGTLAVSPLLDDDKVVMISPLTGGQNIDQAAEYLFRNGPSDVLAGKLPAQVFNEKNYDRVIVFTDNAEYTLDIAKHFKNEFEGVVTEQIILADKQEYRTEILKAMQKESDAALLLTATGGSSSYVIKQLREAGYDKPIYANFIAYNGNLEAIAGEYAEGVLIYDAEFDESSEKTLAFFTEYEERYGTMPSIPFHATGAYDAIHMIVEASNEVGYDGEAIHDWLLENVHDWQGLNGNVSFDEQGNTQTGFVLKQVQNGKLVTI